MPPLAQTYPAITVPKAFRSKSRLKGSIKRLLGRWDRAGLFERLSAHAILINAFGDVFDTPRFAKRQALWDFAVETIGGKPRLLFLEFGVWEGKSIRYFADRLGHPGSRFIGFDSFQGLPEKWGTRAAGAFDTQGRTPCIDDPRVGFVAGWFQNTVRDALDEAGLADYDACVLHFDADLYTSTLFCLFAVYGRRDSFYAVFDEFSGDETRALHNFCQTTGASVRFLGHCLSDAGLPNQVLCQLRIPEPFVPKRQA